MSGIGAGIATEALDIAGDYVRSRLQQSINVQNTEWYMANYGSPEAQMEHMRNAGINPYTAAGNVSGAAGNAPQQAMPTGSNLADSASKLADSNINPIVADKTNAETRNINEDTIGRGIRNVVDGASIGADIVKRGAEAGLTESEASMAAYRAQHFPEFFTKTLSELDSNIRKNNAQSDLFDKQIEKIDKEKDLIDTEINELKSRIMLNTSQAELNEINRQIGEKEKERLSLEVERARVELDRYTNYDNLDPWMKVYYDIEKREGKEAAEAWKKENFKLAEDYNEAVAKGQANGVPQIREMNSAMDIRDNAQDVGIQCMKKLNEIDAALADPNITEEQKSDLVKKREKVQQCYDHANDLYKDADKEWKKMAEEFHYRKSVNDRLVQYTEIVKNTFIPIMGMQAATKIPAPVSKVEAPSGSTEDWIINYTKSLGSKSKK